MSDKLLFSDRNHVKHDPIEIAERLDQLGDRACDGDNDALFSAADVVRSMLARIHALMKLHAQACDAFTEAHKELHDTMNTDKDQAAKNLDALLDLAERFFTTPLSVRGSTVPFLRAENELRMMVAALGRKVKRGEST